MKKLLLFFLLCISTSIYAQEGTKFDCYCMARLGGSHLENILISLPYIEYGMAIDNNGNLLKVKKAVDIFAFFGKKKWDFVTTYTEKDRYGDFYEWLVFKKKFEDVKEAYKEIPLHNMEKAAE